MTRTQTHTTTRRTVTVDASAMSAWEPVFRVTGDNEAANSVPKSRRQVTQRCTIALLAHLGFVTPDSLARAIATNGLPTRVSVRKALCELFSQCGWMEAPDAETSATCSRLQRRMLQHMHTLLSGSGSDGAHIEKLLPIHLPQCRDPIRIHMSSYILIEDAITGHFKTGLATHDSWVLEWVVKTMEKTATVSRWRSQTTAVTWGSTFCQYIRRSGILCGLIRHESGISISQSTVIDVSTTHKKNNFPVDHDVPWCCGTKEHGWHVTTDSACQHLSLSHEDRLMMRFRYLSEHEPCMIAHAQHVLTCVSRNTDYSRSRFTNLLLTLYCKVWNLCAIEQMSTLVRRNGTKFVRRLVHVQPTDAMEANTSISGCNVLCERDHVPASRCCCEIDEDEMLLKPTESTLPMQRITEVEMQRMLSAECSLKHKCILYILFSTGVRRGALCRIRVVDVWDATTEKVRAVLQVFEKHKQRTLVPLTEEVRTAIYNWLQLRPRTHSPYLFPSSKYELSHLSRSQLLNYFKSHALRNGVAADRAHVHATRHTAAMRLIESSHTAEQVKLLLGHRSLDATYRYIRMEPQHLHQRVHIPSLMGISANPPMINVIDSESCQRHRQQWQMALNVAMC